MRVLVYEHLTAVGSPDDPSLLLEGAAMLAAVLADLALLPGIEVVPVQTRAFGPVAHGCDAAIIIAPETEDILASIAYWFEGSPCRLLGTGGDAVRLCGDKLALAEHLTRAGVPTPAVSLLANAIVKPRHGAGCLDTFHLPGDFVIQRHIPGLAASVAFIDGLPLRACAQHIAVREGKLTYQGGSLPLAPDLERRAISLATLAAQSVPGLAGWYGVDLILGETRDEVIEINPRLTTSYVGLRALSRTNLMAVLLGLDSSPPAWRDGRVEFAPDGAVDYRGAP